MLRQQWILKCENNNYQKLADKNISFKSREKTNSIIVTHIKGKMVSSLINMHIAQQHLVCNSLSATPDLENGVKFMNCRVALPWVNTYYTAPLPAKLRCQQRVMISGYIWAYIRINSSWCHDWLHNNNPSRARARFLRPQKTSSLNMSLCIEHCNY